MHDQQTIQQTTQANFFVGIYVGTNQFKKRQNHLQQRLSSIIQFHLSPPEFRSRTSENVHETRF